MNIFDYRRNEENEEAKVTHKDIWFTYTVQMLRYYHFRGLIFFT